MLVRVLSIRRAFLLAFVGCCCSCSCRFNLHSSLRAVIFVVHLCVLSEFLLRGFRRNNKNQFRIRREQSEQMQKELSCENDAFLSTLLDIYKEESMAEISGFHVAAAGIGYSGDIYMGVNLETPFASIGHTIHAEQFVICNAHQSREPGLNRFLVSAVPCGHCRQFMNELPNPSGIAVDVLDGTFSGGS